MSTIDAGLGGELITAAPREGRSVWVLGDRYTYKVTGKQTGGAYGTVEAEIYPGSGVPLHIHHREDESFYVLDGELEFVCGGRPFPARAGAFLHVPRGMLHSFRNVSGSVARMLVTYSPAGFEQFFERAGRVASASDTRMPGTPDDLKRLLEVAPEFNLEIRLPQA